jgi:Mg2+/Co2+ transporter CorB
LNHFSTTLFSLTLILLILLAAFFSCAETALMAANRYRLRYQARMKKRYAIQLLQLLKRPDRLLGVILIGSTLANVLASSLATLLAFHFFGDKGVFVAAILLTFVILIFAEIAPKTLAALYPDRIARWIAYPIRLVLQLFYPIVWLANMITNGLLKLFQVHVTYAIEPLTREELRSVVYDTTGKISRRYQNMLLSILDLNQLTVDDVMVARHDIVGLNIHLPWQVIVADLIQSQQDWLPVYRDDINQIIGVCHTRHLLCTLLKQERISKEMLLQSLQEPYFIPEGVSLHSQLIHFQRAQDKIAFVVDEYGEIQGMLTVNDILEEIVGELTPNVADHERIQKQEDGSYLVDGAMTIREFNRLTAWKLPLQGPKTLTGLIIEYLQALPRVGTSVLISGYPIEIIQIYNNRVKRARIFPRLIEKKQSPLRE